MKFIDVFDKYLLSEDRWERKSHYASDATSCRRELTYKWRGEKYSDPPTAGNVLKMRFGLAAEEVIKKGLDWMVKQGEIKGYTEQVRYEVAVPGLEKPVVLKLDFLLDLPEGKPCILEIKSSFGRGIKEIQQRGRPKDDHLFQVFLYLLYSPAKQAIFAYLGRDNGYRTEFAMWLTEDGKVILDGKQVGTVENGVKWLVGRLSVVEKALKENTLPERDFIHAVKGGQLRDSFVKNKTEYKSNFQCQYCWFKSRCWADVLSQPGDNSEMFDARRK